MKDQLLAITHQVTTPERGESIGAILLRVLERSYPKVGCVEQTHHARQHLFSGELALAQVFAGGDSHNFQALSKLQHPVILCLLLASAVVLMVDILFATGRITPFYQPIRSAILTDLHLLPSGRDH